MLKKTKVTLLLASIPLGLSGCLKDLSLEEQGAAIGGAVGGAGAFIACRLKGNSAKSCRTTAAVGAVAGVISGGLFGKSMEERRKGYQSDEAFYDAQVNELKVVNSELGKKRVSIDKEISATKAEIEKITNDLTTAETKTNQFQKVKDKTLKSKNNLDQRIAEYKKELNINQQILADSKSKGSGDSAALAEQIAQLQEEIATLDGMSSEMASLSSITF